MFTVAVFNRAGSLFGVDKKMVTVKSDVLIISGRRYYENTLDQLGGDLSLIHFNERSNNDLVVLVESIVIFSFSLAIQLLQGVPKKRKTF